MGTKSANRWTPGLIVVQVVLVGIILAVCSLPREEKTKTAAQLADDKLQGLLIRCENETKNRIADTSGIEFAPFRDWQYLADETGDGATLTFSVVAKNAFGVMVPAIMQCHATYDGDKWTVTTLTQL